MLSELFEAKTKRPQVYQILLLKNDPSQEVEVHETEHVNYLKIHEHLIKGGSVFITSKNSQKIKLNTPKTKIIKTYYSNQT